MDPEAATTLPLPKSREPSGEGCCRIRSENAMLETNLYTFQRQRYITQWPPRRLYTTFGDG